MSFNSLSSYQVIDLISPRKVEQLGEGRWSCAAGPVTRYLCQIGRYVHVRKAQPGWSAILLPPRAKVKIVQVPINLSAEYANMPQHASLPLIPRLDPWARSAISHALLYSAAVRLPRAVVSSTRPRIGQRRTAFGSDIHHLSTLPCPSVDLPREATPLVASQARRKHKAQPSHVDPQEGLQFELRATKAALHGRGTSQFENPPPTADKT